MDVETLSHPVDLMKVCNRDLFSSGNTDGNIANGQVEIITIAQTKASDIYAAFIGPAGR